MISSSSSWPVWRAASNRRSTCASCASLQRRGIVRVVEHQALDAVRGRPFAQRAADVGAALEAQRDASPAARSGGRSRCHRRWRRRAPSWPSRPSSRMPKSGRPAGGLARRAQAQLLEVRDVLARDAGGVRHLLELGAVVEGHREDLRPGARCAWSTSGSARACASLRSGSGGRAVREEILQLGPARHRRRAAVPRHRERAAGIGVLAAVLDRLIAQVAAQEAAHEGVAGAQDVEHLDREARALDALLDVVGNRAIEHGAAHRPALDHDPAAAVAGATS